MQNTIKHEIPLKILLRTCHAGINIFYDFLAFSKHFLLIC
jgi:hypothetical protein